MIGYQVGTMIILSLIYGGLIIGFCKRFTNDFGLVVILVFPVIIFTAGFGLRLSMDTQMVDLGYFLTESVSIFLYTLFTGALILGQIKYWKK